MKNAFGQVQSIDFVDVGCSGFLDEKWSYLFPLLSFTGFDPNAEECKRLMNQSHPYKSARYLPYAIAGQQGTQTMYKTESIYCYSLLRPNQRWLDRFSFSDLHREVGTESVACTTLNALACDHDLEADIVKLDTQGLELPILRSGDKLLEKTFCVETETGFVENYIGETTYAQIDEFMRSKGFLMFDINVHPISRKNSLSDYGKHQPLYCEAVWLFDFIGQNKKPDVEQALKALTICKALKYIDYGFELACYFRDLELIEADMLVGFKSLKHWSFKRKQPSSKAGKLLSLFPDTINKKLLFGLNQIFES